MRSDAPDLTGGTYARKQLFGGCALLSWSHRRRFEVAGALTAPYRGRPLLDYGCGDGTFLAMVGREFPGSVGLEVDPELVRGCAERFGGPEGPRFLMADAADSLPAASFGVVVCMEVLEHCPADAVEVVLGRIRRLVARDGRVIISVPVETGLPILVKQAARAIAARRVSSDYRHREHYRPGELLRMLAAGDDVRVERPLYETTFASGAPNRYHGHKGFNWRAMRRRAACSFRVVETRFSPVSWLGPQFASQAWFVCEPL
ncbi:MAG: class I SAM-dependent methyltransferase [Gemmatimonadota bacterium]|nr:class I SAM-dependent methyltransferase [Gemmatimonadota bacterium]MDE3126468.1 class I SAM-dependent methyltransferase [Gemmatimonadota bacterium]MDE3171440.1 class I SAM-dependent methyltransferase [Gemmatimonadota bacterium]MDE3215045.1 class I SAM-dependent methyltransferase [Gemmatimonadota bacterium]